MQTIKQYWYNLPLGRKFASLTSLLVMLAVLTLATLIIQRERATFEQEMTEQANLLLEALPLTMRDQLYRMEIDELVDIARIVSANENITLFSVYDKRGAILVDLEKPSRVLSQEIDPLGVQLIQLSPNEIHTDFQDNQLIAGRAVTLGNQAYGAVAIGFSTVAHQEKIAALTRQSFYLALFILMLGVALSVLFTRQISNPLIMLSNSAAQMAGGNLSVRASLESRDEIGQLGKAFNQMADAIQGRETELRNLAAGLEHTVEERTAELRQQNEKLAQMAISDPLTQIYNRRFFFELAEKEFKRAARLGHPVSIILIDTDHFKEVNDTFGHIVGDKILVNFAQFCQDNIRTIDIIARYGGEEFIILMPETDCEDAHIMAERLRELVAQTPMSANGHEMTITISLGIACWDSEQVASFDALLARADQALYKAKEAGRNQVAVWIDSKSYEDN